MGLRRLGTLSACFGPGGSPAQAPLRHGLMPSPQPLVRHSVLDRGLQRQAPGRSPTRRPQRDRLQAEHTALEEQHKALQATVQARERDHAQLQERVALARADAAEKVCGLTGVRPGAASGRQPLLVPPINRVLCRR